MILLSIIVHWWFNPLISFWFSGENLHNIRIFYIIINILIVSTRIPHLVFIRKPFRVGNFSCRKFFSCTKRFPAGNFSCTILFQKETFPGGNFYSKNPNLVYSRNPNLVSYSKNPNRVSLPGTLIMYTPGTLILYPTPGTLILYTPGTLILLYSRNSNLV